MTKIKFQGFGVGAQVTLKANQQGVTRGPVEISAWKASLHVSNVGELDISVRRSPHVRFAPEGIHFEAGVTSATGLRAVENGFNRDGTENAGALYTYYDPQFHELEFVWETSQTGTFPLIPRHPSHMQAKNTGHGKHFSHVFEAAGAYWVKCSVYRTDYASGTQTTTLVAQRTIDLTVNSMESQFAPADRVYVSNIQNDPDFANLPAGVVKSYTPDGLGSLHGEAQSAASDDGVCAIFLKRGQTFFTVDTSITSLGDTYWGDWGPDSAKPIVNNDDTGSTKNIGLLRSGVNPNDDNRTRTLTIHNIDLRGKWDDISETRGGMPSRTEWGVDISTPCWVNIVGCRAEGFDNNFTFRGTCPLTEAGQASFILWNTESTGYRDYGTFISDNAWGLMVGLIGNKYGSGASANSNMGVQGKMSERNSHAPVRTSSHWRLYVTQNDAAVRFGWSTNAVQPAFRLTTESWGYHPEAEPQKIIFWGNIGENAGILASLGIAGEGHPSLKDEEGNSVSRTPYPLNALAKHNFAIGGWGMSGALGVNYGGVSVIENVFVRPDVPLIRPDTAAQTIALRSQSGEIAGFDPLIEREGSDVSQNKNHPVRYIGNTVIDSRTYTDVGEALDFTDPNLSDFIGSIDYRDNVHFVKNGPFADVSAGPMDVAMTFAPRVTHGPTFDWNSDRSYTTYDTFGSLDLVAQTGDLDILTPAANAAIFGVAAGGLSRKDILGNLRRDTATQGALEPM